MDEDASVLTPRSPARSARPGPSAGQQIGPTRSNRKKPWALKYGSAVVMLGAALALSGCGPTPQQQAMQARQQAAQQQNALAQSEIAKCQTQYPRDQRTRETAVPAAQCFLAAQRMYPSSDGTLMSFRYKVVSISERYRDGTIGKADYDFALQQAYEDAHRTLADRQAQQRIIAATEAQARAANCIAVQQRRANRDYSGLDSHNGFVAVASLLGAIGDAAAVSQACD